MIVQELFGHVSPETAYLVPDYPYGHRVRCRIRYWMERDPRRGYRLVSQTENPKTMRWNAPRRSTYALIAASMYLDEQGHVHWVAVGAYTDHAAALAFARSCPHAVTADLVRWVELKRLYAERGARGEIVWKINGVAQPVTEADLERYRADAEAWRLVGEACAAARDTPFGEAQRAVGV